MNKINSSKDYTFKVLICPRRKSETGFIYSMPASPTKLYPPIETNFFCTSNINRFSKKRLKD